MKNQIVTYKQGNAILEGYLAYDETLGGKRPGVLIAHEWKGLNDYIRMRADRVARLGYVALAVDIYGKGVRPGTVEQATAEMNKYSNNRALLRQRILAALAVLESQPNVDAGKVAAMGYCFGGTTVLELARAGADIKGVVSFHGGLGTPTPQDAKNIKARLLILHGADDPFVPPSEVAGFEKEMKVAGIPYQLIKYPGAVHGFTNPANTGELKGALYHQESDEKSWGAMQRFFKEIFS